MSKPNFLSKPLGTRPILIGLSIHFALWWAALVVLFWTDLSWKDAAELGIPTFDGIQYVLGGNWELGAAGILISFALIGMTLLSLSNRRCWLVLLTHLAVLLYWLVEYVMVGQSFVGFGH